MFSFAKIASLAAVAFTAFGAVSAAPTTKDVALVPRCGCNTVPTVLVDLQVRLEPVVYELSCLKPANATKEVISPLVSEITVIIHDSVTLLNGLVGRPVEEILVAVDGTAQIAVGDLAALVGGILNLLFSACGGLIGLVGIDVALVISLLAPIGSAIGLLLEIVLKLVGDVLGDIVGAILALIGDIVPIILKLSVSVCISIFGL